MYNLTTFVLVTPNRAADQCNAFENQIKPKQQEKNCINYKTILIKNFFNTF